MATETGSPVDTVRPHEGRTAIVTGASAGIGQALARMLGEEGYALTVISRQASRIESACEELRRQGFDAQWLAEDLSDPEAPQRILTNHIERYGRLDVLVNNAGFGIGGDIRKSVARHMDLQYEVNLRAIMLMYREAADHLARAGDEHGNALVINTASVSGKVGTEWLSVYSAMKHGVVGFTEAMNRELAERGIKSCALCPGYVDTDLTEFIRDEIAPESMIQTSDIAGMTRPLLHLSRNCVVPEIVFSRPGDSIVT